QGLLTESDLDVCVTRLFTARMRLGMFDPPERVPYASIPYEVNDCDEHHALAVQAARESIVLLKNEQGLLPLSPNLPSIAVIGPNANDDHVLLANYFGEASRSVTPLEAVRQAVSKDTKVWHAMGCKRLGTKEDGLGRHGNLSEAMSIAKRADVVVLCLGLSAEIEGEQDDIGNVDAGGDKSGLELTGLQQKMMEQVVALGKPTVLVLMAGSAIDISWAQEHVTAIIDVWYPGALGGIAVADVLFGKYNPAGRLPITFPRSLSDVPEFTNYEMAGRSYRYSRAEPLYPFGYGLSYTTFAYSGLLVSPAAGTTADSVTVRVTIENTGDVAGDEVVQLYVEDLQASCPVPLRELRRFERVHLAPRANTELTFELTPKDLSLINNDGKRVLE